MSIMGAAGDISDVWGIGRPTGNTNARVCLRVCNGIFTGSTLLDFSDTDWN